MSCAARPLPEPSPVAVDNPCDSAYTPVNPNRIAPCERAGMGLRIEVVMIRAKAPILWNSTAATLIRDASGFVRSAVIGVGAI